VVRCLRSLSGAAWFRHEGPKERKEVASDHPKRPSVCVMRVQGKGFLGDRVLIPHDLVHLPFAV
jgi:hypothetical protein